MRQMHIHIMNQKRSLSLAQSHLVGGLASHLLVAVFKAVENMRMLDHRIQSYNSIQLQSGCR